MQLDPDDCLRFYKLHQALMFFVNQRCKVIKKPVASPEQFAKQPPEERLKVREALLNQMDLIDAFVAENPFAFPEGDLDIIRSWKDLVAGKFIVFRYLKKHTIFLTMKEPVIAYGVLALSDPFEDLIGPYLPVMCETVLLPFEGRIIYDGLMTGYNVSFGGGYRRSFQESYNQAKERFGIVTHLPFVPETAKKREEIPRPKKRVARSKSSLLGRWRITWMEQWDQDFVDAEVEGYFEFGPRGSGKFQFGYVQGGIDYRVVERDGKPAVEFSWDGNDEMDPAQGRGWAVRDGDEIEGMIFIHRGDESQFRAKRMK